MQATDRELWLLEFYRNSELHGALLMGKMARLLLDGSLRAHLTRHCATEARHAALLTDVLAKLGSEPDPDTGTMQERYSAVGGVPREFVDLLVLSEILEKRVLTSYRKHLKRADVHPDIRAVLGAIVKEMESEADHEGWIEAQLEREMPERVDAAEKKWRQIDREVAEELESSVEIKFNRRSC